MLSATARAAGTVVSVRGSVVEIRFPPPLPPIHTLLHAGDQEQIVIEVLTHRDAHHVRGIALAPTQGLARGTAVQNTGGPLKAPVGKGIPSALAGDSSALSVRRDCALWVSWIVLGLSIEALHALGDPAAQQGRVILAHLGNGASLAAVRDGSSLDTSMGFTPNSGIPMGTRCSHCNTVMSIFPFTIGASP